MFSKAHSIWGALKLFYDSNLKKNIFKGTYIPRKHREDAHFPALIQMVKQSRTDVEGMRLCITGAPSLGNFTRFKALLSLSTHFKPGGLLFLIFTRTHQLHSWSCKTRKHRKLTWHNIHVSDAQWIHILLFGRTSEEWLLCPNAKVKL